MDIFKFYYIALVAPSYLLIVYNIILYNIKTRKLIKNRIESLKNNINIVEFLFLLFMPLFSPLLVFSFIIKDGMYAKIIFCNHIMKKINIFPEDRKRLVLWIDGKM